MDVTQTKKVDLCHQIYEDATIEYPQHPKMFIKDRHGNKLNAKQLSDLKLQLLRLKNNILANKYINEKNKQQFDVF